MSRWLLLIVFAVGEPERDDHSMQSGGRGSCRAACLHGSIGNGFCDLQSDGLLAHQDWQVDSVHEVIDCESRLMRLGGSLALPVSTLPVSALPKPFVSAVAQISDDAIDRAGERVMNGNDFRSVRRQVWQESLPAPEKEGFLEDALSSLGSGIRSVFDGIGNFFDWLFSGRSSTRPAPVNTGGGSTWTPPVASPSSGRLDLSGIVTPVMIGLIVIIVMVIVAMIVRAVDAKKRKKAGRGEVDELLADLALPPGELAASTYESRALQMAAEGNHRAAIRELLLGSMSWIERAGLIRYRRGLTNRDYLRSLWRRPDKREAYSATAKEFEFVYFGRRRPTAEMFQSCLSVFRGAFRDEEVPTASV